MKGAGGAGLDAQKEALRKSAKRRRAEAASGADAAAARDLRARVLGAMAFPQDCVVSAYWPIGSEIDTRPLMQHLHEAGHALCLPVVTGPGAPLVFRAWQPGDPLEAAGFGTQVPGADKAERSPRVLLVPLLAFDRDGYRLGYGGGFYDRTLAKLRGTQEITAVGIAYGAQEVAAVPRHEGDQRLDWIVTESEAILVQ